MTPEKVIRRVRPNRARANREVHGEPDQTGEFGRGDRIRTCDILLPKQARYRTAPLPDLGYSIALVGPAGLEPAT